MIENLELSMAWMLAHEGGYVNHPKDPGGATNKGVTQRVYDMYRRRKQLPTRSVRAITADEVATIYKAQYWDAVRGDELPHGVDYAVFDYAVNSGPKRAAMDLQRVVGAKVDGIIGMETIGKTEAMDPFDVIERLCERRMAFLRSLKHWPTFRKGWTARVMGVKDGAQHDDIGVIDRAMLLAKDDLSDAMAAPLPVSLSGGKAEDLPRESMAQSKTLQLAGAQIAGVASGGVAAVTQLDGSNQTIALVFIGLFGLLTLWIARNRVIEWIEGDR